jgi:hypothetical protein
VSVRTISIQKLNDVNSQKFTEKITRTSFLALLTNKDKAWLNENIPDIKLNQKMFFYYVPSVNTRTVNSALSNPSFLKLDQLLLGVGGPFLKDSGILNLYYNIAH